MLKLGTNYKYASTDFLDSRQGEAKTKEDLKNWTLPVPPGFKVCLDSVWYYYDPNVNMADTGHWVTCIENNFNEVSSLNPVLPENRTISLDVARKLASEILGKGKLIDELMNTVFPLTIEGLRSSKSVFQPGESEEITLTWENKRKGNIVIPDKVEINGNVIPEITTSWKTKIDARLNEDYTFTIKTWLSGISAQARITIVSRYKNYYGTSANIISGTIQSSNLVGLGINKESTNNKSGVFSRVNFNCSPGKYPYILIPEVYYQNSLNVVIGGLVNSDISKDQITIVNPFGQKIKYIAYRTNQIQTGEAIPIEIKA